MSKPFLLYVGTLFVLCILTPTTYTASAKSTSAHDSFGHKPIPQVFPTGVFHDGDAPPPPFASEDLFSLGYGYIDFTSEWSCTTRPINSASLPTRTPRPCPRERESEISPWTYRDPRDCPTPTLRPTSLPTPTTTPTPQSSGLSLSSDLVVLGSLFEYKPTFPLALTPTPDTPQRYDGNNNPLLGLANNDGSSHVVWTVHQLQNGKVRSAGFVTNPASNQLKSFCFVGDSAGGARVIWGGFISSNEPGWAEVTYTRASVCNRCEVWCNPKPSPSILCRAGSRPLAGRDFNGLNVYTYAAPDSFSPVTKIWDGVSALYPGVRDYNADMYLHQFFYSDSLWWQDCGYLGCYYSTQDEPPSIQWGRKGGKAGFREENLHNIYDGTGNQRGSTYAEDPGYYEWDICTGSVPSSPCTGNCRFIKDETRISANEYAQDCKLRIMQRLAVDDKLYLGQLSQSTFPAYRFARQRFYWSRPADSTDWTADGIVFRAEASGFVDCGKTEIRGAEFRDDKISLGWVTPTDSVVYTRSAFNNLNAIRSGASYGALGIQFRVISFAKKYGETGPLSSFRSIDTQVTYR